MNFGLKCKFVNKCNLRIIRLHTNGALSFQFSVQLVVMNLDTRLRPIDRKVKNRAYHFVKNRLYADLVLIHQITCM